MFLQTDFTINSYVSDLNSIIQNIANYYRIFHPIKITLSYSNVPTGVKSLVPVKVSITMLSIFDYIPISLVFVLLNKNAGTMSCDSILINREYKGNICQQVVKNHYLFSSSIDLEWLIMLNSPDSSYKKTFFVNYRPVDELGRVEYMYNMAAWNKSFMLFPNNIGKIKDIQRSMR